MRPQALLFHIPGTKNVLDYDQLKRLKIKPDMVHVKDLKANKFIGKYPTTEALLKFE